MPSPTILVDVDLRNGAGTVPQVVEYHSHPMDGHLQTFDAHIASGT